MCGVEAGRHLSPEEGFELEESISKEPTELSTELARYCGWRSDQGRGVWKDRMMPITKVGMGTDGVEDMLPQSVALGILKSLS